MAAINEELNSMEKNEVWQLVDRLKTTEKRQAPNVIDSRWVLKKKVEHDGSIKYRTRLVVRRCKDGNNYDLTETYAPISRWM